MDADSPIDSDAIDTAAYLAQYATAVLPYDDYMVFGEGLFEEDDFWFDIRLYEGTTINFHPVDDEGNRGAIFYFDDVRLPQPVEDVYDLDVKFEPPFRDYKFLEPPGHHTLFVLIVHEDVPSITAPGNEELHLAHVEWRH